ncbi:MAG TPA: baseplate J/gp47 family protein [Bryobacteraceae bacterium]
MSTICPCDVFTFPKPVTNAAGLTVIRYRLGDFAAFREALIRPQPGEVELLSWRPTAKGDLGQQMLEWWAYLADILTFYNERAANESYLRTAVLPESLNRMIRILGYRPRPGLGATGVVAARLSAPGPIVIPRGFPIQSKPGPGKQPQTFEVDADTSVARPDAVSADLAPDLSIGISVLLQGTTGAIKPFDRLLLLKRGWAGEATGQAFVTVAGAVPEKDARGKTNTRITFTAKPNLDGEKVTDYRLLRSTQRTGLWPYATASPPKPDDIIVGNAANTAAISRELAPHTPLFFDLGASVQQLVSVTNYAEYVFFADVPTNHIPIPHSWIAFSPVLTPAQVTAAQANITGMTLYFGWNDVGQLIGSPAASASGPALNLTAAPGSVFPSGLNAQRVLLEDANGNGSSANATDAGSSVALSAVSVPNSPYAPPMRLLFDLLNVSRGKTVLAEILGNGDATVPAQEFVLQKSPLTYLQSADPTLPDGYKSTLRVWVNGVEWKEAPSFYNQPAAARIFVAREDVDNKTHVQFGDGINGARLPTGVGNVVANYRYGSGGDVPSPGQLTVITQPLPGLKSIENPLVPAGGADPDSPDRIRRLAPRSILTFGRAVSGDDYEVIASVAPGVARARAYWAFDPILQRTVVTVFVGDDPGAVSSARKALAAAADPNRPVVVKQAFAVKIELSFTLVIDPAYQTPAVVDAVRAALLDPDTGPFGGAGSKIGASVFSSQIDDACLRVPGAVAVHFIQFTQHFSNQIFVTIAYRHFPGEGAFYQLKSSDIVITAEVASYAV